jgi:hypothetical protein
VDRCGDNENIIASYRGDSTCRIHRSGQEAG